MKGKLLFLGSGASMGVPVIGCSCPVCLSTSPFNKRLRPSVLVTIDQKQLLIDVGPDFRQQALRSEIDHLDGILFTHAHQDHVAGIDDLRPLYYKRKTPIPYVASQETAKDIHHRFHYIFLPSFSGDKFVPRLTLRPLQEEPTGEIHFEGIDISYFTYYQGKMAVNGFRFGEIAYISDIQQYDPSIFPWLKGVKTLIISALRHDPSPLHLSTNEAVQFIEKAGIEKGWLTHISHDLDHEQTNGSLPPHVRLAYDGLEIDFTYKETHA